MRSLDIDQPLVSVGFPVFNEEANLPRALDSILAQDYEHLEVIVCDNASTDATAAIATEYAARDRRVVVHASDVDRGAPFNFNRCFWLASGRYFSWASGHDSRLPSAIRMCVDALEENPRLALCYPSSLSSYHDGRSAPVLDDAIDTRGLPPILRLQRTIEQLSTCNAIHAVIRSEALAATRLFRNCFGGDHILLAELSLLGEFRQLEEALFVRVENRAPEVEEERLKRVYEALGGQRYTERSRPFTVMGLEHVRGVWHVSEGTAKPANAVLAAFWYVRRWWWSIAVDWHLAEPARAAAAAWRRLPLRPRSSRSPDRM
jgi:glycosyltransferase involved in cell wall biosynthesis